MRGYITVCFSDWINDNFDNGVMHITNGIRTDRPIRRKLAINEIEGVHYYRKPDPDFKNFTYSRCHKSLRQQLQRGDVLFFRTLWQEKQYIIGYFLIKGIMGDPKNPICLADPNQSLLIDYKFEVTLDLVRFLNPLAYLNQSRHFNKCTNEWLGRNYLSLDLETATCLINLLKETAA